MLLGGRTPAWSSKGQKPGPALADYFDAATIGGTVRQVPIRSWPDAPVVVGGPLPGVDLDALRAEGQRLDVQMRAAYSLRDAQHREADELFPPTFAADVGVVAAKSIHDRFDSMQSLHRYRRPAKGVARQLWQESRVLL
ncbi:hypothetical protein [Pseudarthrobacter sp. GA104]|uniref:hypothetical protein n=1 Tax=Pseudarthrobacter sp. GA104 TaxID=2676311 RepID=UPI0012F7A05A|nr:hypothetical protein [Pseudarthrobacter sp. GA104]MUU73839.1 hypothetical protein [Pseudarthrobacter sp. GA104]